MVPVTGDNVLRVTFIDGDDEAYPHRDTGLYSLDGFDDDGVVSVHLSNSCIPDEICGFTFNHIIDWEVVVSVDEKTLSGVIVDCGESIGDSVEMEVDRRK